MILLAEIKTPSVFSGEFTATRFNWVAFSCPLVWRLLCVIWKSSVVRTLKRLF